MNEQTTLAVKKVLYTVILFFSLFLFLAGLHFLSTPAAEEGIKNSAQTVLHQWNNKAPGIGEKIHSKRTGWAFTHIYATTEKSANSNLVFIVRLTGNSGPYTGVFYYTPQKGTVFCGLAGLTGAQADAKKAQHYGITERIISQWIQKLDSIAQQTGDSK